MESNKKPSKINLLSCSLVDFFSEILDQLFHQPQLLHYLCIVLIDVYTQKQGWHYIHFLMHPNCNFNLMLKCQILTVEIFIGKN